MARWVAHITHAGDIGRADVLVELRRIAPVTAIRGNIDTGDWAGHYPDTQVVRFGGSSSETAFVYFSELSPKLLPGLKPGVKKAASRRPFLTRVIRINPEHRSIR